MSKKILSQPDQDIGYIGKWTSCVLLNDFWESPVFYLDIEKLTDSW